MFVDSGPLSEICPSPHPNTVQLTTSRQDAESDFVGVFQVSLGCVLASACRRSSRAAEPTGSDTRVRSESSEKPVQPLQFDPHDDSCFLREPADCPSPEAPGPTVGSYGSGVGLRGPHCGVGLTDVVRYDNTAT